MGRIAIIADDLTGASDTGVQFARKGLPTRVLFDAEALTGNAVGAIAVAVDTDTRAAHPEVARCRAGLAARNIRQMGFEHVFKKIDSTLRGNLGQEIDGIMAELDVDFAVVAPAFPKLGRTTAGGRHFLRGVPLEETEIARDPKCPVHESRIPHLIGSQASRKTGLVELETLRRGDGAVVAALKALRADGAEIAVFDALEDEDLRRTAQAVAGSGYRVLWVGSAGLADYLPDVLGLGGTESPGGALTQTGRPALVVAGSISPTTREQVAALWRHPGVAAIILNPLAVLRDSEAATAERSRCEAAINAALAAGRDVVLASGSAPEQVAEARALGAAMGLDGPAVSDRIAAALGEVTAGVINHRPVAGLILTGGDTARAVCRTLGVSGLEVIRELEAGVPLSRLAGCGDLPAITKAGAFGTEQSLVRALRALKGE